jgi:hypothetical protein
VLYFTHPLPPNVQIYSPNLFLNYYIFIIFCLISLALTKHQLSRVFCIIRKYQHFFRLNYVPSKFLPKIKFSFCEILSLLTTVSLLKLQVNMTFMHNDTNYRKYRGEGLFQWEYKKRYSSNLEVFFCFSDENESFFSKYRKGESWHPCLCIAQPTLQYFLYREIYMQIRCFNNNNRCILIIILTVLPKKLLLKRRSGALALL